MRPIILFITHFIINLYNWLVFYILLNMELFVKSWNNYLSYEKYFYRNLWNGQFNNINFYSNNNFISVSILLSLLYLWLVLFDYNIYIIASRLKQQEQKKNHFIYTLKQKQSINLATCRIRILRFCELSFDYFFLTSIFVHCPAKINRKCDIVKFLYCGFLSFTLGQFMIKCNK